MNNSKPSTCSVEAGSSIHPIAPDDIILSGPQILATLVGGAGMEDIFIVRMPTGTCRRPASVLRAHAFFAQMDADDREKVDAAIAMHARKLRLRAEAAAS